MIGRRDALGIALLLTASTVLHVAFIGTTELDLFPDEAQYWDWSRQLGWSYYSKPPLVAYVIRASCELLGASTPFAVRLPAALLATATTAGLWLFAWRVSGSAGAALAAATLFRLAPLYVSEAVTMTTDSLLLLFWVLFALALRSAVFGAGRFAWVAAGLAAALGLLSKYTMVAALVWAGGVLVHQRGTARRSRGWILAGGLVALLGILPPLIWNAQNGWASFRHVYGNAGKSGHLGPSGLATAGEFLASQFGVLTPIAAGLLLWALARCLRGWQRDRDEIDLFCLWGALPLLLFYFATSFGGRSEANWAAPAYVAALAALARHAPKEKPRLLRAALLGALPFTLLAYRFDLVYDLGLHLPPRADPTTRMRGWSQLGRAAGLYLSPRAHGPAPFVLADTYQVTAELAFYVPGQPRAYCADTGRRRNQYDFWPGLEGFLGRDALYAADGDFPRPHHLLRRAFARFERLATVVHRHRGREVRRFSLFRLSGYRGLARPDYDDW